VNGTISPTLFSDVLSCAVEQGFGEASFFGPGAVPAGLVFGRAEVEFNAASVVLTFAQRNGFPRAWYVGSVAAPTGITLPTW